MNTATARVADPYLAWAVATGFAGHSAVAAGRQGFVPVLIKAPRSAAPDGWHVPPAYRERPLPFWTAWVPAHAADMLARWEAEFSMSLPVSLPGGKLQVRQTAAQGEADLVIGVIDQGCAFLNRSFSRADAPRRSRFISLWRQRPAGTLPPWQVPGDFGYGLEINGAEIDTVLAGLNTAADEAQAYERLGYPVDAQGHTSRELHGTQVLDIAAGLPQDLPPEVNAKPSALDAAAQAALVFVEMPQPLPEDATGAAGDAFLLDAVHYVLRRAGPRARVVVNLSVGSLAGPHDGSSLIEQALDALVQAEGGRLSICVAAGNAAQERWHAAGALRRGAHGESAALSWRTVPGDQTDSFLELWCFGDAGLPLPPLEVDVTAPDGRQMAATLGADGLQFLRAGGAPEACLDLRTCLAFDGRPRAMALLSLAPTAGLRAGQAAGVWRVVVRRLPSEARCELAAWLQRDTPGLSRVPVLQSEFEAVSDNLELDGRRATSSLSGAQRLIVVGAMGGSDGQPSSYSPTVGIRAWAASDESPSALGKLCTGALSGSTSRIAGTSAAAPMVARELARGWARGLPRRHGAASLISQHAAGLGSAGPLVWFARPVESG